MSFDAIHDTSTVFYVYDTTFDGLMTAVFTAVYDRAKNFKIISSENIQISFNARYTEVLTDKEKSERVINAANDKIGKKGMRRLWNVYLSDNPEKETVIYDYLMLGFKFGSSINFSLADDSVLAACKISENVSREAEKFRQFLRFNVTKDGIHHARFAPQNYLLPIITPFFIQRLRAFPFLIHDVSHGLCSVYDTKTWYISSSDGFIKPDASENDEDMHRLWKVFFDSVAIKSRENIRLQKQNMPSRYFRDAWYIQ